MAYGLPWRRRERLAWGLLRPALRRTLPLLPASVREWPHARVARERLRGAQDGRRAPGHRAPGVGPFSASGTSEPRTGG